MFFGHVFFVRKNVFFCSEARFFGPNGVHRFSGGEAPRPPWPVYWCPAQKPEEKISGLRRARAKRARIREKKFEEVLYVSPKSGRQNRFSMAFIFCESRHTFCSKFCSFRIACYFLAIFFSAVICGASVYCVFGALQRFWGSVWQHSCTLLCHGSVALLTLLLDQKMMPSGALPEHLPEHSGALFFHLKNATCYLFLLEFFVRNCDLR